MPAYHSKFKTSSPPKVIGGVALLPIIHRAAKRGAAPVADAGVEEDIIDEALKFFKANVFFATYAVKGENDRLLLYLTLYIHQCLTRMTRCASKDAVLREMNQLGIESFKLPFDDGFPLSSFYKKVTSKREADELRQYLLHCRQECGLRLAERVCDATGKPSKWWLCFTKRRFLGKSLEAPGAHVRGGSSAGSRA